MSNVTGRPALVAPWGGAEPRMTTNLSALPGRSVMGVRRFWLILPPVAWR